jgi:hypothetical protein
VSFAPAGEDEWVVATRNRPIVTGDRLWVAEGGRAELQMGFAVVRLDGGTSIAILNLDDRMTQFRVEQGALNVRVRNFDPNAQFEIDTPNLAFTIRRPGEYRIDTDPNNDYTAVVVRSGSGEAYGQNAAYTIANGQSYAFSGTNLEPARYTPPSGIDQFDSWVVAQDQRYSRSISARYVAPEVIGYQDLDDQGSWRVVAEYGNVWFPRSVPTNWAPYRYGHWSWIEPWGWTWVDDAPWGFAPFHYGRWAQVGPSWGWVPGPVAVRPVYAPALVAFVGGNGFSLSVSVGSAPDVAWFPLGPGEIYRPGYQVSRAYFTNINTSNTKIVNVTNITNIYNNPATINQVNYKYRQQPTAVTAVTAQTFARAEPVGRSQLQVNRNALQRAQIVETAQVAPVAASVIGPAARANARPRDELKQKPTIAHATPPAATSPFAQREAKLAATPGKPPAPAEKAAPAPSGRRDGPMPVVMATPNAKAQALPATKAGGEPPPPRGVAQGEAPRRAEAPPPAEAPKGPDKSATSPFPAPRVTQEGGPPKGQDRAASAPQPPRAMTQDDRAPKGQDRAASAPPKAPERAASAPPTPSPQRAMTQEDRAPKGQDRAASAPPPPRAMTQDDRAPKGQDRAASAPPPPREAPQARAPSPQPAPERAASAPPLPPQRAMTQERPPQREPQAKAPPPPREQPQVRAPSPQPAPERAAAAPPPPPPRGQAAPPPPREPPQAKAPPPPREQPQAQGGGNRRDAPTTADKGKVKDKDKDDDKNRS